VQIDDSLFTAVTHNDKHRPMTCFDAIFNQGAQAGVQLFARHGAMGFSGEAFGELLRLSVDKI
jgi:hypothetical protein